MSLEPIDFDLLAYGEHGSVVRARDTPSHIVHDPEGRSYIIAFEDSENVHEVELHRNEDGYYGDCWTLDNRSHRTGRCRGNVYHDAPCAHLWAVRSFIARQHRDHDVRHDNHVERAVADVGRDGSL